MTRYLNRLFNIRTDEWPRLLILYSMAFLFIAGMTWGELAIIAAAQPEDDDARVQNPNTGELHLITDLETQDEGGEAPFLYIED